MRVVIGIDWSEQAFDAVQQTFQLYRPTEVTLVHGVDLGVFKYPLVAAAANMKGYDEFHQAMLDMGWQLMERMSALIPPTTASIKKVCEFGSPAGVILDAARAASADLVVMGARGRGRAAELLLGSVSHRVLLHAGCATLVVKGVPRKRQRVLVAIEGSEDAQRIQGWLLTHPFTAPVDLTVTTVVQRPYFADPSSMLVYQSWTEVSRQHAEDLVKTTGAALLGPQYTVDTQVLSGDPAELVAQQTERADLLVIGSHGRKGLARFLLGSVSHTIVHRAACPVLVVR